MMQMTRILYILGFLFLSWSASGQNYFTTKVGFSLANQSPTGGSPRFGIATGVGYEYQISKVFWVAGGIDYVNKGTFIGVVANVTEYTRRINYWDVPLSLKYKYFFSPSLQWGFFGGVNIGFANRARDRFFSIGTPQIQELGIGTPNGASTVDFGVHIGGELNFTTDYGQLTMFALFNPSLTSALIDPLGSEELTNNALQAGFLIKFGPAPYDPQIPREE